MNPVAPPESAAFAERIRTFLADRLPPGWTGLGGLPTDEVVPFTDSWRKILHDNGLLAPAWPKEYGGGGLTQLETVIMFEEFAKVGAPTGGTNDLFSISMLGNTLLHWGTEEQKRHYIPKLLSNEHVWCQGFSEPNAGSDLAGLACRATLDGDEWVINGQKIWNTYGHRANHIFLLARNDPDAGSRHKGITFLLVPMDQDGVDVRPIKMMSGESEFNEVFLTDARCPAGNVVGEVGGGWAVAMTLLGFERGEAAAVMPIRFREELDRLVSLAVERGHADDPVFRQRIAGCHIRAEIMRFLGLRTLTGYLAGRSPGTEAAITKLYWSEYHRDAMQLAVDLLGADAMVPTGRRPSSAIQTNDPAAPNDSAGWVHSMYAALSGTIYAGTSEVQRNIIGERILGLPKG